MKAAIALSILLFGANDAASNSFLPREVARFILVLLPILTGATICVLILYDDHVSSKPHVVLPRAAKMRIETGGGHTHRSVVVSIVLVGIIATLIIGGATIAFFDYYTMMTTGSHIHFNLPIVASTGNSFLDLSTLMLAALTVGVLLIVGILIIATWLKPKPEDLVGWTRPEHLLNTDPVSSENRNISDELSQPPSPQPFSLSSVVCRYCGREIAHGRYCSDCHLTSGYVVTKSQ